MLGWVKSFTSKGNYTFQIQGIGGKLTTLKIEKLIITKMKKAQIEKRKGPQREDQTSKAETTTSKS
jgi:hypothetical protein